MSRPIQDFQRIYNALYHGRTTYFKKKPKDYTQIINPMAVIEANAKNNPESITAKALKIYKTKTAELIRINTITSPNQKNIETVRLEKWIFYVVHHYCASHSGFFSRTSNPNHELSSDRKDLKQIIFDGLPWVVRPKGRTKIIEDHLNIPCPTKPRG